MHLKPEAVYPVRTSSYLLPPGRLLVLRLLLKTYHLIVAALAPSVLVCLCHIRSKFCHSNFDDYRACSLFVYLLDIVRHFCTESYTSLLVTGSRLLSSHRASQPIWTGVVYQRVRILSKHSCSYKMISNRVNYPPPCTFRPG